MNHLGTVTLQTEHLLLRRFKIEDTQKMFDNWANDEEVTKYLVWQPHQSISDTQAYLTVLIKRYDVLTTYEWAIELKEIGEVIGSIGVARYNDTIGCAHIGYCIGKEWWNKGITAEAFKTVIEFLIEQVQTNRIEARHDPNNPASGKVMKKCGLKYEGTFKESDINNQGICDASWYGLIRKDYYNMRDN